MNYLQPVQHVEFFHRHHFEHRYHRRKARKSIAAFVEFFWETDFDDLFRQHPEGFCDALFPNVGYTYLINLGTPFVMQLGDEKYEVKNDGFLPRHKAMVCHHRTGNKVFGIKFRVSPVALQKRVNFSEYREYIFPLAYLIDRGVVEKVRRAAGFNERVRLLSDHYESIVAAYEGSVKAVEVVTQILHDCAEQNAFAVSVEELAARYAVSSRTLQRYFETATGISSKQALQILRIRKAVESLLASPQNFQLRDFGYYDYSHFFKHLRSFLAHETINMLQPHLQLLTEQRQNKKR